MDSIAKQDLRVKLETLFRLLYDLNNAMVHMSFDEEFNKLMMSQVLTIGVKVIHQTRTPGKVDPSDQPSAQVIDVGRATQKAFQKAFEDLELKRSLTTIIPIVTRQAAVFTSVVEQLANDIEKIYDFPKSGILLPGMEVSNG